MLCMLHGILYIFLCSTCEVHLSFIALFYSVKFPVFFQMRQVSGPWEQQPSYYVDIVCEPCPPCPVPLPVTCWGGHETVDLPCSNSGTYSCERKCGRQLGCTNHTCGYACHQVTNAPNTQVTLTTRVSGWYSIWYSSVFGLLYMY